MLDEKNQRLLLKTARQLNIPEDFVYKDMFVTQAIHALSNIEDPHYVLVFQGGTSLAKGHMAIERMSEDVDFRIVPTEEGLSLSKNQKRRTLRNYRNNLLETLTQSGLEIPDNATRVFYEGRFFKIRAFIDAISKNEYLKPHIAIECFVGDAVLPTKTCEITTLIKARLPNESDHETKAIPCVAIDETAAEKWVALTRRVANTEEKARYSDKQLVRHLYDLFQLSTQNKLQGDYIELVGHVMKKDQDMYQKDNNAYYRDPVATSKHALTLLSDNNQWQEHWKLFMENMVYGKKDIKFADALHELNTLSQPVLKSLDKLDIKKNRAQQKSKSQGGDIDFES